MKLVTQLQLSLVTAQKIYYAGSISLYELTRTTNLKNLEDMDFSSVFTNLNKKRKEKTRKKPTLWTAFARLIAFKL